MDTTSASVSELRASTRAAALRLCALVAPAIVGCGSPDAPYAPVLLQDHQNFAYSPELFIESSSHAERQDIRISWPALTQDLAGQPFAPQDELDWVALRVFRDLTAPDIIQGLLDDSLQQTEVTHFGACEPEDDGCRLSDFWLHGHALALDEHFEAGTSSWLVSLHREGAQLGVAYRFLVPDSNSASDQAEVGDESSALEITLELNDLEPIVLPRAGNGVRVDWSALTQSGRGDSLEPTDIDSLQIVGLSDDEALLSGLPWEAVLDEAEQVWEAEVVGPTELDLSDLGLRGGRGDEVFALHGSTVWLLTLDEVVAFPMEPLFLARVETVSP